MCMQSSTAGSILRRVLSLQLCDDGVAVHQLIHAVLTLKIVVQLALHLVACPAASLSCLSLFMAS